MAKVLVTGGAGFIGSHLVDALVKDHEVVVYDDLSGGYRQNVNPKAKLVVGSINDNTLLQKLFAKHKFDYVFHLAAYAAEGLSPFIRYFNYENNLLGSINVINASVNNCVKRILFTSSIAVYGHINPPFDEAMTPRPADPYAISKYAIELDLQDAYERFGLEYTIFRPFNVYGPRQNMSDKYRNVVAIFMNQCLRNEPLTIYGDGDQLRAFSYIGDIVPAMVKAMTLKKAGQRVINIGGQQVVSVNQLAEMVKTAFGNSQSNKYLPPRQEVKFAYSSLTLAERLLGFRSKTTIKDGLKQMAKWAREQGPQELKHFRYNYEIEKNIPANWK